MQPTNGNVSVSPWNPSAAEEQALRTTDATADWLCHLPAEVLRQFAGKWVAAKDKAIIASGDTYEELLAALGSTELQTVVIHRLEKPAWVIY